MMAKQANILSMSILWSVLGVLLIGPAQAEVLPLYRPIAVESMLVDIDNQTVFTQTTQNEHCPQYIELVEGEARIEGQAVAGDRRILLVSSGSSFDGFTYEGNSFYIRGLPLDKKQVIDRDIEFPYGVAYSEMSQTETATKFISEYSSVMVSLAMTGTRHYTLSYEAELGEITYAAKGSFMDDVNCTFRKHKAGENTQK